MTKPIGCAGSCAPCADQLVLLGSDVRDSLRNWRFWLYLGWNDIAKQYRRSFIGPVWIVLNSALFIVAFGMVGAQLFKLPIQDYLPYFCAGHVLFGFFTALLNEGCQTYIEANAFLKQTAYPKIAFVLRVVWRNTLMLAHNMIVVIAVLLWSGHLSGVHWGSFATALLITFITAILVVAVFGVIAARFRDIPMIVASLMQISFFVTPVMWRPDQLTERAQTWIVHYNPLAAYLDLLRSPLLGHSASPQSWILALAVTGLLAILFVALYRVARRRIVYWL